LRLLIIVLRFRRAPKALLNAELSGGMNMLGCEADLAGEVPTASAICWRRANQQAGN